MKPTIYDVSKLAGVSTATVSRVFSNPDKVNAATLKKVMDAAATVHYTPNAIARAMAKQKTDKIAYIICKKEASILDEFYAAICEGIMSETIRSEYELLIATADDWEKLEKSSGGRQVDGVILAGDASPEMVSSLQEQGVAVVLVNNAMPAFSVPSVVSDEQAGVKLAVDYFLKRGRKRIALLMGQFSPYITKERYAGFQNAVGKNGVPRETVRMCQLNVNSALEAAMELLQQSDRPDAVLAANDVLAAGVMKAASRLKLRVPQDVAVIGVDDSMICGMLEPELTSVHIDCHRMGQLAATALQSAIARKDDIPNTFVVPEELKIRESAG